MVMSKKIKEKCKKIDLVLTDVDGVLTDGGMFYSVSREELKKFNARDWMAVELLRRNGVSTIFLTKDDSKVSKNRAKKLKAKIFFGIKNKEKKLSELCKSMKINPENIAYIGDDVNDIDIIKLVGLSASPNDAVYQVKKIVDYICENNGGSGAFREFADMILKEKFPDKTKWY